MSQYSDPRNLPEDPTAIEAPPLEEQPGYAPPIEGEQPPTETPDQTVPPIEEQPGHEANPEADHQPEPEPEPETTPEEGGEQSDGGAPAEPGE